MKLYHLDCLDEVESIDFPKETEKRWSRDGGYPRYANKDDIDCGREWHTTKNGAIDQRIDYLKMKIMNRNMANVNDEAAIQRLLTERES